jgi:hypothetical protein
MQVIVPLLPMLSFSLIPLSSIQGVASHGHLVATAHDANMVAAPLPHAPPLPMSPQGEPPLLSCHATPPCPRSSAHQQHPIAAQLQQPLVSPPPHPTPPVPLHTNTANTPSRHHITSPATNNPPCKPCKHACSHLTPHHALLPQAP